MSGTIITGPVKNIIFGIKAIPKGVNITLIIPSACHGAICGPLCSNPHSQTSKNPETAFHKRQFQDFSQFRPIIRKQVKNDTIYLAIWRYNYLVFTQIFLAIRYLNDKKLVAVRFFGW